MLHTVILAALMSRLTISGEHLFVEGESWFIRNED